MIVNRGRHVVFRLGVWPVACAVVGLACAGAAACAQTSNPTSANNPFFGSVTSGFQLGPSGANYYVNGTHCPTDAIAIYGATTTQAFTCRWAP